MASSGAKSALRAEMKRRLKLLTNENRAEQSRAIANKVIQSDVFKRSRRIGVYLSMAEEVHTDQIVKNVITSGKECFVPRYNSLEMVMVKLHPNEKIEELPLTKWNIRQPLESEIREDAFAKGGLDLIVVPGLAFTLNGHRLGRGKGYYDSYLSRMKEVRGQDLRTIGIGYTEQILSHLPVNDHDFILDEIICSDVT